MKIKINGIKFKKLKRLIKEHKVKFLTNRPNDLEYTNFSTALTTLQINNLNKHNITYLIKDDNNRTITCEY